MLASNAKQIIFFIIRAAVNFGFYKLSEFGFKNMLDMPITFVWFIAVVTSFYLTIFMTGHSFLIADMRQ